MKIANQNIKIDVGSDYLDYNDKNNSFSSVSEAIAKAYKISKELCKPIKVVLDTNFENGDYKIQNIAVINYRVLDCSVNGLFKSELLKIEL